MQQFLKMILNYGLHFFNCFRIIYFTNELSDRKGWIIFIKEIFQV
ncbi:hypothetical protein ANHYDRO_02022 [Anaerococcus hydrogenalis DSM 7454]|uniref:Uncharacterized protein n=1 Tax=Anaerococcus hydrogenalis DSM 7454 TaxID=561177 RepID=B6WBN9_9FIRM|nr:hypothetical protein ANHYDRO_02022 [Anaerococcus hydrogenalis DSM 7454]